RAATHWRREHDERIETAVCRACESTTTQSDVEAARPASVLEADGRRPDGFTVVRRSRRRSGQQSHAVAPVHRPAGRWHPENDGPGTQYRASAATACQWEP